MSSNRTANEAGFTLIELLIVMIVLAIVLAVSIPIFVSQRSSAARGKTEHNIKAIVAAVEACAAAKNPTSGGYTGCADEKFVYQYEDSFKNNDRMKSNFWVDDGDYLNRYEISGIAPDGSTTMGTSESEEQVGYIVSGWIQGDKKLLSFTYRRTADGEVTRACSKHPRICPKGTW